MKEFEATIVGTYITKRFKCNDMKEANREARKWANGFKSAVFLGVRVIELAPCFYSLDRAPKANI